MSVIERLRELGAAEATADFAAAREAFAVRALAEGLVDVSFQEHETPMGPLLVAATGTGVVAVGLTVREALLERVAREISPRVLRGSSEPLTRARRQLDEYFAGRRREFDVAQDWTLMHGFRRDVLTHVARIPYGQTRSYGAMAALAGSPRAVRAAGSALATNPLPLIVPCHRVLRSDGSVGHYGGGSAAKVALLAFERGEELPAQARFGERD